MKLIGLAGFAGCGKDTVGQHIVDSYNYGTISFADSLKDCLASIFGWERSMLEGKTPQSRKWREQVDPWWSVQLGIPHFTPRFAMTNFGTDVMRQHFNNNIWILNTERKLMNATGAMVITDLRFPNEFDMVRRLGGDIYRIVRGDTPHWVDTARAAIHGDAQAKSEMDRLGIHQSEWVWLDEPTDAVIDNNSSIESLHLRIDELVSAFHAP